MPHHVASATGSAGAVTTATCPLLGGSVHAIYGIEIVKFASATVALDTAPNLVVLNNVSGSPVFTVDAGAMVTGQAIRYYYDFPSPLISNTKNTNTTLVAPAVTGVIWRLNVFYSEMPVSP